MGIGKSRIKYIKSLKEKKYRKEHNTFVAEGNKMVYELLGCMKCQLLLGTSKFLSASGNMAVEERIEVSGAELQSVSFLKTPQQALGVFYQPEYTVDYPEIKNKLSLALDGIQDPGNFGTIMRLADWYGIEDIFCSKDTVDVYNPKTVQATMGALARVKTHYLDLIRLLEKNKDIPLYGTFLEGENIYKKKLTRHGIIVMGNEGNGVRPEIGKLISQKLYIPNYPQERKTSESLNVSIATAIICSEFRREYY